MKILLNQKYGLGNQLFQYAAALYYAAHYKAGLEIIREHDEAAESHGHPRICQLNHFNITTPVRDRNLLDRILRSQSQAGIAIMGPLRKFLGVYSHDPWFKNVGELEETLPLPVGTRVLYLNGLFQVHQFAERMQDRLRQELKFRQPPTGANEETLKLIQNAPCAVSLHLRRGDYTVAWQGKHLLPQTYYDDALRIMNEAHSDAEYFVFSDDIEAARNTFPSSARFHFVDNNNEASAYEDLRLMASCQHHILANSTFSWWGAWLNPRPEKLVLVPDPWHMEPHPNLIPPAWRRVARTA